jgi:aminoglycoside phosphotransferase family enzyme
MPSSLSVEALQGALSDPALCPYDPDRIEIEQTHISVVAVAPPWVYKFKKPVDLGFLDFSTLEKRRHYCHEEVRLNRRFCPDVYEGLCSSSGPTMACGSTPRRRRGRWWTTR